MITKRIAAHLRRQRAFSLRTFGPGARTEAVIAHLRKKLAEVEAAPDDVTEWADLVLLACDGVLRQDRDPVDIAKHIKRRRDAGERRFLPGGPPAMHFDSIDLGIWECQTWPGQARSWVWLVLAVEHAAECIAGLSWPELWRAAADKLAANERRNWPDGRTVPDGQPIEHLRPCPGPVPNPPTP